MLNLSSSPSVSSSAQNRLSGMRLHLPVLLIRIADQQPRPNFVMHEAYCVRRLRDTSQALGSPLGERHTHQQQPHALLYRQELRWHPSYAFEWHCLM